MVAAAGAAILWRPHRSTPILARGTLESIVPLRIGDYRYASSTGLIVPDASRTRHIYDQVLTRIYVADSLPPVMLLIAYGSAQNAGLAVHRPESCYPASGYALDHSAEVTLDGIQPGTMAIALTASRQDRVEQIYYWTRIGRRFPTSQVDEDLAVFAANFSGLMPDGVLVRLSIRSVDRAAALAQMRQFNTLLLDAGGYAGRRLLLGTDLA